MHRKDGGGHRARNDGRDYAAARPDAASATGSHELAVEQRLAACKYALTMKIAAAAVCLAALFSAFAISSAQDGSAGCQFTDGLTVLPGLWEASGVAVASGSPTRLWVINDSEGPVLYGVGTDGRIVDHVMVAGAHAYDWEDLSAGPCPAGRCLFIADIGDNAAQRPEITVYRIPEPARGASSSAPAIAFHAKYPDGPHNAESLFVDTDQRMFVITKGRFADVYRFPTSPAVDSVSTLEKIGRIPLVAGHAKGKKLETAPNERATGAALSTDSNWVAIRSNQSLWLFRAADFIAGRAGQPVWVDLSGAREPQGEGIAFGPNQTIFLVGEGGSKGRPGSLRTITCALPR